MELQEQVSALWTLAILDDVLINVAASTLPQSRRDLPSSNAQQKMRRILVATVLATLGPSASGQQPISPPPAPVFRCNTAISAAYTRGCITRFQIDMEIWRANLQRIQLINQQAMTRQQAIPPPLVPGFSCPNAMSEAYLVGCIARFHIEMEQWRAEMQRVQMLYQQYAKSSRCLRSSSKGPLSKLPAPAASISLSRRSFTGHNSRWRSIPGWEVSGDQLTLRGKIGDSTASTLDRAQTPANPSTPPAAACWRWSPPFGRWIFAC